MSTKEASRQVEGQQNRESGGEREGYTSIRKHRVESEERKHMYTITVGFFGGLFASVLTYIAHFLNFLPFGPGVIWQHIPYYKDADWLHGPLGHAVGIVLLSFLSILVAFVYYLLLRKIETPWTGIWFGVALWALLFIGVNRLFPGTKTVFELGHITNVTFVCIFILYGLFVGYSISYQYRADSIEEERDKES